MNEDMVFEGGFYVTQYIGQNVDYYKKVSNNKITRGHEGLDAVPKIKANKKVKSLPLPGRVVVDVDMAEKGKAYGKNCSVYYPDIQEIWQYCHFAENYVSVDQQLPPRFDIGLMGDTGNTTGEHVHINRFKSPDGVTILNRDNGRLGGIDPLPVLNGEIKLPNLGGENDVLKSKDETSTVLLQTYEDEWNGMEDLKPHSKMEADVRGHIDQIYLAKDPFAKFAEIMRGIRHSAHEERTRRFLELLKTEKGAQYEKGKAEGFEEGKNSVPKHDEKPNSNNADAGNSNSAPTGKDNSNETNEGKTPSSSGTSNAHPNNGEPNSGEVDYEAGVSIDSAIRNSGVIDSLVNAIKSFIKLLREVIKK